LEVIMLSYSLPLSLSYDFNPVESNLIIYGLLCIITKQMGEISLIHYKYIYIYR
jgi:hypothetical protein